MPECARRVRAVDEALSWPSSLRERARVSGDADVVFVVGHACLSLQHVHTWPVRCACAVREWCMWQEILSVHAEACRKSTINSRAFAREIRQSKFDEKSSVVNNLVLPENHDAAEAPTGSSGIDHEAVSCELLRRLLPEIRARFARCRSRSGASRIKQHTVRCLRSISTSFAKEMPVKG